MKLTALSRYLKKNGVRHRLVIASDAALATAVSSPRRGSQVDPRLKDAARKLLTFLNSSPAGKKTQDVNEFIGEDTHLDVALKTLEYRGYIQRLDNIRCTTLKLTDKGKQLIGA